MTPEALATLHAQCFDDAPRAWDAAEFAELLASPTATLLTEGEAAFALLRRVGPEAEILTLCTAPAQRRRGLGTRLLQAVGNWALNHGVEEVFLEVAETNAPARALYTASDYQTRGHRKDYYSKVGRRAVSALVMSKTVG